MNNYNFDETFAFLNIIYILSKTHKFRNWLKEYHKVKDEKELFEGYKFILTICLKCFIGSLLINDPFKLKDDEILQRADFRGIHIKNIPNCCEKLIVLKNIWHLNDNIRKSENFDEIQRAKPLYPLIKFYQALYNNNIKSRLFSKRKSIICASQFWAYLFLIDTRKGFPKGSLVSIVKDKYNPEYLDKVFKGYSYSLEYLWFHLLGKKKFTKSFLNNLHRSTQVDFSEPQDYSLGLFPEVKSHYLESEKVRRRKEKAQVVYGKWQSIDQFFEKIREEIILPSQKETHEGLGPSSEGLLKLTKFHKSILGEFLTGEVSDAPYVNRNDIESKKKQIDVVLRWYHINVLDAAESFEFNGAYAFIFVLKGYIRTLREEGLEGKVLVQIIKHPIKNSSGYDYSFGILIGVQGIMSDSSGWLIFLNCANDISGTGGHLYDICKKTIENAKSLDAVEVREFIVDINTFQQYLGERNVMSIETTKLPEIYKDAKDIVSNVKGKFFEYLVFKWLSNESNYKRVECDKKIKGEQIDCYAFSRNSIDVFECKLNLHEGIDNIIKQVNKKSNALKKEYPTKKIRSNVVIFGPILSERKNEFNLEGIRVFHDFRSIIQKDRNFEGSRREILKTLSLELRSEYEYR